jgi:hypothetical protein
MFSGITKSFIPFDSKNKAYWPAGVGMYQTLGRRIFEPKMELGLDMRRGLAS